MNVSVVHGRRVGGHAAAAGTFRLASPRSFRNSNPSDLAGSKALNSNCSCISIKENGEYTYLDGFVVGKNSSGKPLCDISR